jgi:hypothetical protein
MALHSHISSMGWTIGLLEAAFQTQSYPIDMNNNKGGTHNSKESTISVMPNDRK